MTVQRLRDMALPGLIAAIGMAGMVLECIGNYEGVAFGASNAIIGALLVFLAR